MVMPLLSSLVLPVFTLPLAPKSMSRASFAVSVPLPSDTTPILLSVSLLGSVAPPLIVSISPSLRVEAVPLSPAKVMGFTTSAFRLLNAVPTLSAAA